MLRQVSTTGCVGISVIPSSTMCTDADSCIQTMDSIFQSLSLDLQARFQASHDSILAAYNNTVSWYSKYIPFSPSCSSAYSIAQEADVLSNQMNIAQGGQAVSGLCCNAGAQNPLALPNLFSTGTLLAITAIAFLLLGQRR